MPASFNKPLESSNVFLKMNRCFTICPALLIMISSSAQSDFIQLKKKNKVESTWFKGNYITLQLNNGQWLDAIIHNIKYDSLYLRPYALQTNYNRLGINYIDTIYYGFMAVSVNNVKAFPKQNEGSGLIKRGVLFKWGGGGYIALNIINTLGSNKPLFASDNLPKISIATAVLALGIALAQIYQSTYVIGKKYHIEYVSAK